MRSRANARLPRRCRTSEGQGEGIALPALRSGSLETCRMDYDAMLERTRGSAPADLLRVLMVHWDGGGNLPPQRALARELIRRGHDVHVLTHDTQAASVASDGATFHSLANARQWNPARPNTADEEQAFIFDDLAASSIFAADFLATHAAL